MSKQPKQQQTKKDVPKKNSKKKPDSAKEQKKKALKEEKAKAMRPDRYTWLWINIVIFGAIMAFIFVPQAQQLLHTQSYIQELLAQTAIIEESQLARIEAQDLVVELSETSVLETVLYSENDILSYVTIIEGVAAEAGIEHRFDLETDEKKPTGSMITIPATLYVNGGWNVIMNFFSLLEQTDIYINPTALTCSQLSVDQDSIQCVMQASTYWSL